MRNGPVDLSVWVIADPEPRLEVNIRTPKGREWLNRRLKSPVPFNRDKVTVADTIEEVKKVGTILQDTREVAVGFRGYAYVNGEHIFL